MKEDLISVIVPIYKVEDYLENCIRSIQNQTYDKLQIILVEDGSPDACGLICDKFAEQDSRIVVIHKENDGVSDARNAGLDVSEGEFIAFVDSDDYIHPRMFQILLENLRQYEADISVCSFQQVNDFKFKKNDISNHVTVYHKTQALENLYNEFYVRTVVTWNKIYKKSLFEDVRYPTGKIHEDEFITYQLLYKSDKIVYTDAVLYNYLKRESSITGQKFNINKLDVIQAHEECFKFMYNHKEMDLFNKAFNRYLHTVISCYFKIKKNKLGNNDLLNQLKCQFDNNYREYFSETNFSFKKRVRFESFIRNEHFCKIINFGANFLKGVKE